MSGYNGWSRVPLTPGETWEQRAESFVRGMSEVDQAGGMLAVERARAKRWKAAAKAARWGRGSWYRRFVNAVDRIMVLKRERDDARAALMRRVSQDAA